MPDPTVETTKIHDQTEQSYNKYGHFSVTEGEGQFWCDMIYEWSLRQLNTGIVRIVS